MGDHLPTVHGGCGLVSWIAIYKGSLAGPRRPPSPTKCHPYFPGLLLSLVEVLPAGSQVSIFEQEQQDGEKYPTQPVRLRRHCLQCYRSHAQDWREQNASILFCKLPHV